MSKNVHTEAVNHLFDAILSLENKEECYRFLKMSVPSMSCSHSRSAMKWQECCAHRNLSRHCGKDRSFSATISRVNRSLNYGNDGYDMVFERYL